MQKVIVALLLGCASAFVAPQASKAGVAAFETKADLEALAKSLNPIVGFWDPLNVAGLPDGAIYGSTNEQGIAWYRAAEIKHSRVAMAAFVGYCLQANGVVWPTKMTLAGDAWPSGTPPEQWDALPEKSKWQIILFVGVLELFGESAKPHYMRGGQVGRYPSFSKSYAEGTGLPHPVPFDLFDPFGFSKNASEEKKARGLKAEINNGRLAMLGIFGFMSASKVSGSVPMLSFIPAYDGDYMAPFAANFHLGH